jgi:alpha-ketoglutarate-dependent taurine dioxygenase
MINDILRKGFELFDGHNVQLEQIITDLKDFSLEITRDVIISNVVNSHLTATDHDFWFHTDGVFMDVPPEWIIIQVLRADSGGSIELYDTHNINKMVQNIIYKYGKPDQFIKKPLIELKEGDSIFRYRKDYMASDIENAQNLHTAIEESIEKNKIVIGELKDNEFILINNWRFLHRRNLFKGERTIRRIWINK